MFSRSQPDFKTVFISPHFDDAVLSSCLPLIELSRTQPVLLVTLFTQGQDQILSTDARQFITSSGARTARSLFQRRAKEDRQAAQKISPKISTHHFGFIDGLFRTIGIKSSQSLRYPSFSALFSGRLHPADTELLAELETALVELKAQVLTSRVKVFAPAGVGHHADHLLTHLAVSRVFSHVQWWEDSPYNLEYSAVLQRQVELGTTTIHRQLLTAVEAKRKTAALQKYASQLSGLSQVGLNPGALLSESWYELP